MNDCNHTNLKCMQCHRYVNQGNVPITNAFAGPAMARIKELEDQLLTANTKIEAMQKAMAVTRNMPPMKGWPGELLCD
jgi:hypothetical protein